MGRKVIYRQRIRSQAALVRAKSLLTGRSPAEAHLLMVALDCVAPEDWGLVNRTSPQARKWERIKRLCTRVYQQGVALSLQDLAHLGGLSVDAIQNTIVVEMSLWG